MECLVAVNAKATIICFYNWASPFNDVNYVGVKFATVRNAIAIFVVL